MAISLQLDAGLQAACHAALPGPEHDRDPYVRTVPAILALIVSRLAEITLVRALFAAIGNRADSVTTEKAGPLR